LRIVATTVTALPLLGMGMAFASLMLIPLPEVAATVVRGALVAVGAAVGAAEAHPAATRTARVRPATPIA
jgi:hypothetical protein